MNSTDFYHIINHTRQAEPQTAESIDSVIQKYPAFHNAYLIKAKLLTQQAAEQLDAALPKIAINVRDRSILYDYLYKSPQLLFKENEVGEPLEESTILEENVEPTTKIEETTEEATLPSSVEQQKEVVEDHAVTEPNITSNELKQEDEKEIEENSEFDSATNQIEEPTEEVSDKGDTVEQQEEESIEEKRKRSAVILKILEENRKKKKQLAQQQSKEEQEKNIPSTEEESPIIKKQIKSEPIDKPTTTNKKETTPTNPVDSSSSKRTPLSFTDWLKNKKGTTEEEMPLINPSAAIEAQYIIEGRKLNHSFDNFISEQIDNKKEKKEQANTTKTSLISQTLAEVYALQQKYEAAIEIYEQLILKYPQKSSYFARQIEKIKNQEQ